MKKILQSVFLRGLCAFVLGVLLLAFSHEMSAWMVYASGGLFIVMGAVALINYFRIRKDQRPSILFSMVSVGSILFGVVQILFPDLFFEVLRYILATLMFVLALFQLYSFIVICRGGVHLRWTYYLVPVISVGISSFVVFYRGFEENDFRALLVLGAGFVVYALLEWWMIFLVRKRAPVIADKEVLAAEVSSEPKE